MAWIQLTELDLKDRLASNELAVWDSAGQDVDNVVSRVPGIIKQTTSLVRGRVATCTTNTIDLDPCLIPDELLWAAATIAKNMILASIPASGQDTSEERRDENRRAHEMLDQAADCKLLIANDDGITGNQESPEYGGAPLLDF
jgi:hypothetical protein